MCSFLIYRDKRARTLVGEFQYFFGENPRGPAGTSPRSRSQLQSPEIMANLVSIVIPVDKNQAASGASVRLVCGQPRDSWAGFSVRRVRRRLVQGTLSENSSSIEPRASPPVRLPGGEPLSLAFSYDKKVPIFKDPESLALIWRKLRANDCVLPDLDKHYKKYVHS